MKFTNFAANVAAAFDNLSKHQLYTVDIPADELFETYLKSFPEGTNPIYLERTEHDCNCCKNYIRDLGNVVAIIDGKIHTIWDVEAEDEYGVVANALNIKVSTAKIKNVFLRHAPYGAKIGNRQSIQTVEDGNNIVWNHFESTIPQSYMSNDKATKLGHIRSNADVFKRGLDEITEDALTVVSELIAEDAVYRGAEFKESVNNFIVLQKAYKLAEDKDIYIWENVKKPSSRLRNTVIGSLLQDLSEGMEVTRAVTAFELKVAGANYKRPKAVITKGMIDAAMKTIKELGIEDSLYRRVALLEDVSINNVIFADSAIVPKMKDSIGDLLAGVSKKPSNKNTKKGQEISIESFMSDVIPTTRVIEAMLASKHTSNLMTLVAPVHAEAPNILAWDNNFSWAYAGNLTDSDMRANVKKAGGSVEGVLRCSIQWNESGDDGHNDLDLHCQRSNSTKIYYSNKAGILDVDVTDPVSDHRMTNGVAVENMVFPTFNELRDGKYEFYVHNFSGSNSCGFNAELEIGGVVHEFSYPGSVRQDVPIATVVVTNRKIEIISSMSGTTSAAPAKPMWNITTNEYHKVSLMCLSPNFWDDNKVGNKHFFFLLDQCENPDKVRGLYNEFLRSDLTQHRKVFETLGNTLKCPDSHGLSGLGFSSTVRNELAVKVDGRPYTIKF